MEFAHPTLGLFLTFLRKEHNWTEVKTARILAGEQSRKDTKYDKANERLKQFSTVITRRFSEQY